MADFHCRDREVPVMMDYMDVLSERESRGYAEYHREEMNSLMLDSLRAYNRDTWKRWSRRMQPGQKTRFIVTGETTKAAWVLWQNEIFGRDVYELYGNRIYIAE